MLLDAFSAWHNPATATRPDGSDFDGCAAVSVTIASICSVKAGIGQMLIASLATVGAGPAAPALFGR